MKVKIKKEGKKKTYNLINSWSDVNLKTWAKIVALETGSKTKQAEETIANLSDIPKKLIKELALRDVAIIMGKLAELQGSSANKLEKTVTIDGVEYGMHPDLNELTLGEYADLENYIKGGLEKNMPQIMAVLFRKIISKEALSYTIEPYDGKLKERTEVMNKLPAEQVQSSLVFFWNFANELLRITPSVLVDRTNQIKRGL
tara:strand:+ start:1582 stop:2184 length:603 start_codon:yes stop_codon:yes gene_type:complete